MMWSALTILCGVVVALLQVRRKEHGRIIYLALSALIIGAGITEFLKEAAEDRRERKREMQMEKDRQELRAARGEIARNAAVLEETLRFSIQQVSELKSEVKTAEVEKKLWEVTRKLTAMQKVVAPGPKARLRFGFDKSEATEPLQTLSEIKKNLVNKISVSLADRTVRVRLLVLNESKSNAIESHIWFFLPKGFEIINEENPKRLQRTRDSPPNVSYFRLFDLPAEAVLTAFIVDIKVPPGTEGFRIGFRYSCRNCVENDYQEAKVLVQASNRGRIG